MGFLQICSGVVLLQISKSAKDVPDTAVFKGDLDQVRQIGEQEEPESEPKADAIRGTAAILRRLSVSRQNNEQAEARRFHEEKMKDQLEPVAENEIVEWDGLRRRKTIVGDGLASPIVRRKTAHPPLGMSHFPEEDLAQQNPAHDEDHQHGFFETVRTRASSILRTHHPRHVASDPVDMSGQTLPQAMALADMKNGPRKHDQPFELSTPESHVYGLPEGLRKPLVHYSVGENSPRSKPLPAQPALQSPAGAPNIPLPSPLGNTNRRQFSFQNIFRGPRSPSAGDGPSTASINSHPSRSGMGSRSGHAEQRRAVKTATEEERLGLVRGDSHAALLDRDQQSDSDRESDPSSSPPPPPPPRHEIRYPYPAAAAAATESEYAPSSPEARTPLFPKRSYLLSSSTLGDGAPPSAEPYTPGYFGSHLGLNSSAPPPPLEEEPGVEKDWQTPSHDDPHQHRPVETTRLPHQPTRATTVSHSSNLFSSAGAAPFSNLPPQEQSSASTSSMISPRTVRRECTRSGGEAQRSPDFAGVATPEHDRRYYKEH